MGEHITKSQKRELEEAEILDSREFYRLMEEYTGIEARPYTAYQYYDNRGNYIGDSSDSALEDLLEAACIKVVDDADDHD